jgi:acyl-coenzyme A synthetase/AMP-(fatty) acid ligase
MVREAPLPRNPNGKIDRRALAEAFTAPDRA